MTTKKPTQKQTKKPQAKTKKGKAKAKAKPADGAKGGKAKRGSSAKATKHAPERRSAIRPAAEPATDPTPIPGRVAPTLGATVTWSSQSRGSVMQKTGLVIEVVPMFKRPQTPNVAGAIKRTESYIVEIPGAKGGRPKAKIYWPRVDSLRILQAPIPLSSDGVTLTDVTLTGNGLGHAPLHIVPPAPTRAGEEVEDEDDKNDKDEANDGTPDRGDAAHQDVAPYTLRIVRPEPTTEADPDETDPDETEFEDDNPQDPDSEEPNAEDFEFEDDDPQDAAPQAPENLDPGANLEEAESKNDTPEDPSSDGLHLHDGEEFSRWFDHMQGESLWNFIHRRARTIFQLTPVNPDEGGDAWSNVDAWQIEGAELAHAIVFAKDLDFPDLVRRRAQHIVDRTPIGPRSAWQDPEQWQVTAAELAHTLVEAALGVTPTID